jgi:thymidylate synthase
MNPPIISQDATMEWLRALANIFYTGARSAPRNLGTKELLHQTFFIDLNKPVVRVPQRKLNYAFMAAEAFWILTGDDTVAGIAPYNSHIAQFSDDGTKFTGAYGPRIKSQLAWVVDKLLIDPSTRQAGLVIWKDMPTPSRDIPCTVAIWFSIREDELNVHVFMRSSDVWLGLPYDVFSFSMLAWLVAGRVNQERVSQVIQLPPVKLGHLALTTVSSHLYDTNAEAATAIMSDLKKFNDGYAQQRCPHVPQQPVPPELAQDPDALIELLKELRESKEKRWWL